jgi:hypothetical protein
MKIARDAKRNRNTPWLQIIAAALARLLYKSALLRRIRHGPTPEQQLAFNILSMLLHLSFTLPFSALSTRPAAER